MRELEPTKIVIRENPDSPRNTDSVPWADELRAGIEHHFPMVSANIVRSGPKGREFAIHIRMRHNRFGVPPATRKRVIAFMQGFMLADTGVLHK